MSVLVEEVAIPSVEVSAGEQCSLDHYLTLPDHTMDERIAAARARLGQNHGAAGPPLSARRGHPLRRLSPATPTNSRRLPPKPKLEYIVFCGVHFMAESADVLGRDGQQVILPDLNAGCSMADMAEIAPGGRLLGSRSSDSALTTET